MRLDLHVHSTYSHDSKTRPEEILKKASRVGLDGVVITEHHSHEASAPWDAVDAGDLLLLRGAEYKTREGHLLIYGITSDRHIADKYTPLAEMIRIADGEGWALVAPHPFKGTEADLGDALLDTPGIHALELNSRCTDEQNQRVVEAARQLGLPLTGGSDAHFSSRVGRYHTVFEDIICTMEQLVEALREGRIHAARLAPDDRGAYCILEDMGAGASSRPPGRV